MAGFIIFCPPLSRVLINTRSLKKDILSRFLIFRSLKESLIIIDSSNRFCPLTASRSSPEGEHLLDDILICPECVLSVSLMCALNG